MHGHAPPTVRSTSTSRPASRSRAPGTAIRASSKRSASRRPGSSTRRRTATAARCPRSSATRLGADHAVAGIDTFFFSNSGAEATEAAVKLAWHATGRPNVIVVQGGFHGRTYLTMAMTTSKVGVPRRVSAASRRGLRHVVPAAVRLEGRRGHRGRARARRSALAARHADRARRDRRVRDGAGARRGRIPSRARRPSSAARRDLRRARHPVRRRRGADRVRAHRTHVRGRALGRAARHHGDGQGHRVRLPDLGDRRVAPI